MMNNEILRTIHEKLLEPLQDLRDVYNKHLPMSEKTFKEGRVSGYVECLKIYENAMEKYENTTEKHDTSDDDRLFRYLLCCMRLYKEVFYEEFKQTNTLY